MTPSKRPESPPSEHYPRLAFRTSGTSWADCTCGHRFGVVRTDEGIARHVEWIRAHRAELAAMTPRTVAELAVTQ